MRIRSGSVPDRVHDLLTIDGGWLTSEGIAHDLSIHPEAARQAISRLHRAGLVVKRPRGDTMEYRA